MLLLPILSLQKERCSCARTILGAGVSVRYSFILAANMYWEFNQMTKSPLRSLKAWSPQHFMILALHVFPSQSSPAYTILLDVSLTYELWPCLRALPWPSPLSGIPFSRRSALLSSCLHSGFLSDVTSSPASPLPISGTLEWACIRLQEAIRASLAICVQ